MEKTFIEYAKEKLDNLGACTGETAALAHCLSQAIDRLQVVMDQADKQFSAGHQLVMFRRQQIDFIRKAPYVE